MKYLLIAIIYPLMLLGALGILALIAAGQVFKLLVVGLDK